MDDELQSRADRILDENIELIESYWAARQGMGRRYVEVSEVPRPDKLLAFAIRPRPWAELPEPQSPGMKR